MSKTTEEENGRGVVTSGDDVFGDVQAARSAVSLDEIEAEKRKKEKEREARVAQEEADERAAQEERKKARFSVVGLMSSAYTAMGGVPPEVKENYKKVKDQYANAKPGKAKANGDIQFDTPELTVSSGKEGIKWGEIKEPVTIVVKDNKGNPREAVTIGADGKVIGYKAWDKKGRETDTPGKETAFNKEFLEAQINEGKQAMQARHANAPAFQPPTLGEHAQVQNQSRSDHAPQPPTLGEHTQAHPNRPIVRGTVVPNRDEHLSNLTEEIRAMRAELDAVRAQNERLLKDVKQERKSMKELVKDFQREYDRRELDGRIKAFIGETTPSPVASVSTVEIPTPVDSAAPSPASVASVSTVEASVRAAPTPVAQPETVTSEKPMTSGRPPAPFITALKERTAEIAEESKKQEEEQTRKPTRGTFKRAQDNAPGATVVPGVSTDNSHGQSHGGP